MKSRFVLYAWLLLAWVTPAAAQDLVIRFLDVGQGDAILIENGGRYAMIDAGPRDDALQRLRDLGVDTLALFVASHNHSDHIGGADAILTSIPVGNFLDNGYPANTQVQRRVLELVRDRGVRYLKAVERTITLGDATLRIIPPPVGRIASSDQNNRSVVLVVERGNFRALLSGDSELAEIQALLESNRITDVDVLKAAHHGSRNGVSEAWLRAARPEVVAVSLGARNSYGHPHASALALYRNANARVLRTDRDGEIIVRVDPTGRYAVSSERVPVRRNPARRRRPTRGNTNDLGSSQ